MMATMARGGVLIRGHRGRSPPWRSACVAFHLAVFSLLCLVYTITSAQSQQPSQPAIVRRLYHHSSSPHRTTTSHYAKPLPRPPGVARVTPISIQSPTFDSTIRLAQNRQQHDLLQKPTSSVISVGDVIAPPSTSTSTTTTTTSAPLIENSRQSKALLKDAMNRTSSSNSNAKLNSNSSSSSIENLCFLSHGGSSETFAVNEAVSVNSVIGTIKVIGDASPVNGNIELSIIPPSDAAIKSSTETILERRADSNGTTNEEIVPIRIEPGTKNLVLARKLDKESVEGESSVTIGVRCRPKRVKSKEKLRKLSRKFASDDSESEEPNGVDQYRYWAYETENKDGDDIIIPIRILVTDANDNRPEWQGSTPYAVNISEMTSVGSVVLSNIRAVDNDQLGPFSTVEYYVEPGPYSHLLRFSSPLEGTLILSGSLDYETLPMFSVTIRAQDQGNPPNSATAKVEVTVLDADDQNPRFEADKYTAYIAEGQRPGDPLTVQPKPIHADDPDRAIQSPIVYELNEGHENSYFKIEPSSGEVSLKRPLHASVQLPLTLVIRATQKDNRDRYALTTLTIVSKRHQIMPELRFMHANYSASLLETTPPGQVVLTVQTSHPPDSGTLRFQLLDDDEGYFQVKPSGELVVKKSLDYEKHHKYSFRVMITDGRQSDVARVTIEVLNVNEHDPVFSQLSYVFHVNEPRLRSSPIIGQIQASDADDGDRVQISVSGPHASAFALSADGTLRLRSLRLVNSSECHLIATATDSGTPPRSSSASVVVKFSTQLLKSFSARNLDSLLWDDSTDSSAISPTAVDILQHSAANIFSASTSSSALVLVIVLGVLLGTLFIIIVALTLHVLKNRKFQARSSSPDHTVNLHRHHPSSSASSTSSSSSSSNLSIASGEHHHHLPPHTHHHRHHNLLHHHEGVVGNIPKRYYHGASATFAPPPPPLLRSNKVVPLDSVSEEDLPPPKKEFLPEPDCSKENTTEQQDSAISSDMSSSSTSCDAKNSENSRPDSADSSDGSATSAANQTGSVASRISVIRWPQGSIPRRVKKLTWKDEQRNNAMDALYTSNQTVSLSAKTKTLSGHLLTGATPAPPPLNLTSYALKSSNPPPTAPKPKEQVPSSEQPSSESTTHYHHYHHHHAFGHGPHHHQTPHYPPPPATVTVNQLQNSKVTPTSTLPDLTVYF